MTEHSDDVLVGHWTDPDQRTGCTVIVFPAGTVASGEVRGGAPATREFELLGPHRTVHQIDAVVLTGGSAFGLATADGVVQWLSDRGRGFETRIRPVPIVVAMALFDLDEEVTPPGADQGRAAAESAVTGPVDSGRLGAGAGATMSKWRGIDQSIPGGIGVATARAGDVWVTAVVAVNAVGEIDDGSVVEQVLAGTFEYPEPADHEGSFENTTIGVLWTNAAVDKIGCRLLAEGGHDGLGRALVPSHTPSDGDAVVAASVGDLEAPLPAVRLLATVAVEQAVRSVAVQVSTGASKSAHS